MHDHSADDLVTQLATLLPPEAQPHARPLAQLITAVGAGTALPNVLQAYLAENPVASSGTAQALAGHTFSAAGAVVGFGNGNTFGDLTIGNVVAGNQVNVVINMISPSAPVRFSSPDSLQAAILAYIASAEAAAMPCFVGDIASAVGQSIQIVADEVELLAQAGYVQSRRKINGTSVQLTAAGRKIVRRTAAS